MPAMNNKLPDIFEHHEEEEEAGAIEDSGDDSDSPRPEANEPAQSSDGLKHGYPSRRRKSVASIPIPVKAAGRLRQRRNSFPPSEKVVLTKASKGKVAKDSVTTTKTRNKNAAVGDNGLKSTNDIGTQRGDNKQSGDGNATEGENNSSKLKRSKTMLQLTVENLTNIEQQNSNRRSSVLINQSSIAPKIFSGPINRGRRLSVSSVASNGSTSGKDFISLKASNDSSNRRFSTDLGRKIGNVSTLGNGTWAFKSPRRIPNKKSLRREPTLETQTEEGTVHFPVVPRFSSSMSAEAQFAMLKGYEDLLHNKISENIKEPDVQLRRTETPTKTYLDGVKEAWKNHDNVSTTAEDTVTEGRLSSTPSVFPRKIPKLTKQPSDPMPLKLESTSPISFERQQSARLGARRLSYPIDHDDLSISREVTPVPIPIKKQLMLSYRFQHAMDIVDRLKEKDGHHVTSSRYRTLTYDPIEQYTQWNCAWKKEFVTDKKQ